MAHDKRPGVCADAEKEETIFFVGMVWIVNKEGVLISEDRSAFLEGYSMLALVDGVLAFVPYKS
jgi:hypothetical protein